MSSIEPMEYNSRLKEIVAVLRKHSITKGVTPLKLREIIEDLGPTFINSVRSWRCILIFYRSVIAMS